MAITLVKPKLNKTWYTLQGQEGEDDPAKFEIMPLNQSQYTEVLGYRLTGEAGKAFKTAFNYGVKNWSGILDEDGSPLPCKPRHFSIMDAETITEIGAEIIERTDLTDEERKNS